MPAIPQDLLDRIRALERAVQALTGRSQIRPALSQILAGDVRIGEGGRIIAEAANGSVIFMTGQTSEGDWAVGLARETGEPALTVGDDVSTSGQMIRLWSRGGDVLVMDDAHAHRHLGRPWIPFPLHPTPYAALEGTTTFELAHVGRYPAQNAVLELSLSSWCNAGGEVRVNYAAGGETPRTIDQWSAAAGAWTPRTITYPLHRTMRGTSVLVQVEHRNTTSTNSGIQTRVFSSYTRNTASAAEVPDAPLAAAASEPAAPAWPPAAPPPSPAPAPAPAPGLRAVDD